MTVKIRIRRPLLTGSRSQTVAQRPSSTQRSFQATLAGLSDDWVVQRPSTPGAPEIASPKKPQPPASGSELPAAGSLTRAFSWLQTKYALSAAKRLRVSETVSLGEKRFVAIVKVEGREFLIGGGPQGVSLLTALASSQEAASVAALPSTNDLRIAGDLQ